LAKVRDWCFEEDELVLPDGTRVPVGEVCAVCLPTNDASKAILVKVLGAGSPTTSPEGVEVLRFEQSRAEFESAKEALADE